MIHTLASLMLLVSAMACIVFVVAYHVMADWRSSSVGKNVMAVMSVAAILLTVGVIRQFVPWLDDHIDEVRLVAYTAIAVVMWWRVVLLFQEQAAYRRQNEEKESVR